VIITMPAASSVPTLRAEKSLYVRGYLRPCMFQCKSAVVFLLLVMAFTQWSCLNREYKYEREPQAGIFLSFDDYSIDQWFKLREMFLKYEVKATFFITRFHTLSDDQIEKLRILQSDGHEIGFHGANHVVSEYYIKEHSLNEYLQNEIIAGLNAMNEKGFYPTSFAYPYSAKYWGTDDELLKYFYVVRSSVPVDKQKLVDVDEVFYSFGGKRLTYSVSIDRKPGLTMQEIEEGMLKAIADKNVLMFHGHEPVASFDVETLEGILKLAKKHQLRFFRATDLIK
jgi:peptidoglycan-N-acetylglucosamine deacetylase